MTGVAAASASAADALRNNPGTAAVSINAASMTARRRFIDLFFFK
jgi:hypothetical protein